MPSGLWRKKRNSFQPETGKGGEDPGLLNRILGYTRFARSRVTRGNRHVAGQNGWHKSGISPSQGSGPSARSAAEGIGDVRGNHAPSARPRGQPWSGCGNRVWRRSYRKPEYFNARNRLIGYGWVRSFNSCCIGNIAMQRHCSRDGELQFRSYLVS